MDVKEVDLLRGNIHEHWYYCSKARAMQRFLGGSAARRILDVGAGSGFFSRYLLQHTDAHEAWCVDISYPSEAEAVENGKPVRYLRAVGPVDADLVLLMDVLEHVDDDVALLREYAGKVPAGSRFLITVPAFQFLWSGHDEFLEHRRRYTVKQLDGVVREAGLLVQRSAYYFAIVFPLAAAVRLAQRAGLGSNAARSQLRAHHPLVNWMLKSLSHAELPLMNFNRAAGLTVFCLASKA